MIEQRTCQKFLGKESGISGFAPVVKRNNCPVDLKICNGLTPEAPSARRAKSDEPGAGVEGTKSASVAVSNDSDADIYPQAQENDAVNRALMLTATVTAVFVLCYARAVAAVARSRRPRQELKQEIQRWEDEGGNVAATLPARSAIRDATL